MLKKLVHSSVEYAVVAGAFVPVADAEADAVVAAVDVPVFVVEVVLGDVVLMINVMIMVIRHGTDHPPTEVRFLPFSAPGCCVILFEFLDVRHKSIGGWAVEGIRSPNLRSPEVEEGAHHSSRPRSRLRRRCLRHHRAEPGSEPQWHIGYMDYHRLRGSPFPQQ